MEILGLNTAYHESSVCLVRDGRLITAAEEERFNRVKHAKAAQVDNPGVLPMNALEHCLREGRHNRGLAGIDHVGFSLDPGARLRKNLAHQHPYPVPDGAFGSPSGERLFHDGCQEVEASLESLGFRGTCHFLPHHDCHAASAFFVSPFEEAAVLVVDGIGEWESTTSYLGTGNHLERLTTVSFPNSIGLLWEKISKFLGFTEYDACKVMGLASYGDAERYLPQLRRLLQVRDDGTFTLDDSIVRLRNEDYTGLEEIFGLSRRTRPIELAVENQRHVEVAAALQRVTEEAVLALAHDLKRRTGARHLCLAGGVALNCVANGKLLEKGGWDELFVQPAAHDAGTALGAAYLLWNQKQGQPRTEVFKSPYLGPSYSPEEIQHTLDQRGLTYERPEDLAEVTAGLIAERQVVGWFQGAMELGPRALGNRSILGDPGCPDMLELLNEKVKHREPFRPLCPSVLAHKAAEWFEMDRPSLPANYMLTAHQMRPERRAQVKAVTHVDGSSRMQLVEREGNEPFFQLISAFERLTGVPMVLNTSFNNSEPIVCSPNDAINTFLETQIDALVVGPFLVRKAENIIDGTLPDLPLTRYFENLR